MNLKDFNFDLKHLRAFQEVVNEKSFTNASRKLKVSQASISHQIGQIENMLGVKLIYRSSQEFELTEEGRIFLAFCDNTMQSIDKLKDDIKEGTFGGVVRVIASSIPGTYILPEIIRKSHLYGKDVFFRLDVGNSREAIEKIKQGDADLALVGRMIKHPSLKYRKIIRDEVVLAAAAGFNEKVTMDNLGKLPFIMRENGSGTRNKTECYLNDMDIHPAEMNIILETSTSEGLREAVLSGLGLAFISKYAIKKDVELKRIKIIDEEKFRIERFFYLVNSTVKGLYGPAKLFLEYIENHYPELPE